MTSFRVERARPDDAEAMLDLFNTAFRYDNPNHPDFQKLLPDLYAPPNFSPEDHLIIRNEGRPVAGLAVFPLVFSAGPNLIDVAGIGTVSTHPNYRQAGMMTCLMKAAEKEMDACGFPLNYLGGDRARYARYGFEAASYQWQFHLTRKYLADVDLRGWTFGEPPHLEPWMHLAIENKPFRRSMSFDLMKWAVRRRGNRMLSAAGPSGQGIVVYQLDEDEKIEDWIGTPRLGNAVIQDWGGPAEAILALVTELARTSEGNVYFKTPACADDLTSLLQCYADRCTPCTSSNLRIGNLRKLLSAYLPWLSRGVNVCPWGVTIRITDADQEVTLVLDEQATLTDGPGRFEIALSRLEASTFLFGPFPPSRVYNVAQELNGLDAVFPLPFFYSGISWI